ncbi:MAG: DUF2625 family protein [Cyanobacteria bacterium REEB67]|nr:DUF2625 family protein [Cyanobacteria bacterium REEB67]
MRQIKELVNTKASAWPDIISAIKSSKKRIEVLTTTTGISEKCLVDTQVTTRSPMGAIIYHSGGIIIDSGWLRFLGSGNVKMQRSLPSWNEHVGNKFPPKGFVLCADDAIGGFFAIDGGIFKKPGNVFYCPPDSGGWQDTTMGFGEFLNFCITGPLDGLYGNYRWTGWEKETEKLSGDQGLFIYPPLFAEGPEIGKRDKILAPIREIYEANVIVPGLSPTMTT